MMLIAMSFSGIHAQSGKTPEVRVKSFYGWYLKSINDGPDPDKNKAVMNSHLSRRFSSWYFSKAGQDLDYDIFVNGQDWNDAWADNINVGKAAINGGKAVVKVELGSPTGDWNMTLTIGLVKEVGTWKIDRVKGTQ